MSVDAVFISVYEKSVNKECMRLSECLISVLPYTFACLSVCTCVCTCSHSHVDVCILG